MYEVSLPASELRAGDLVWLTANSLRRIAGRRNVDGVTHLYVSGVRFTFLPTTPMKVRFLRTDPIAVKDGDMRRYSECIGGQMHISPSVANMMYCLRCDRPWPKDFEREVEYDRAQEYDGDPSVDHDPDEEYYGS